jgi:hypothetical protein
MTEYTVTWTIQVEAENEQDAAIQAWQIQHDPDSEATFFEVEPFFHDCTHRVAVDLANHPDWRD